VQLKIGKRTCPLYSPAPQTRTHLHGRWATSWRVRHRKGHAPGFTDEDLQLLDGLHQR
jgi:hypothetical protein